MHGKLAVTVADTGLGFGRAETAGTGIGLANIRERLKLLYGNRASMDVAENPPSGTVVTITVPYQAQAAKEKAHEHVWPVPRRSGAAACCASSRRSADRGGCSRCRSTASRVTGRRRELLDRRPQRPQVVAASGVLSSPPSSSLVVAALVVVALVRPRLGGARHRVRHARGGRLARAVAVAVPAIGWLHLARLVRASARRRP